MGGANVYDNAGNPTTLRGIAGLTYNSDTQRTPSANQWAYDGNGNPTWYRGRECTYDVGDRLASMRQGNSWSIGYTYRADGLMATRAKTVYVFNSRTGQWTPMGLPPVRFYHDGAEPLFEESGPANAPTIAAVNVRGPDGLVARKQGSTWTYYAFDQQGNVSQRLNASGTVVSSSVYDAYGAEMTSGTAPTDACGYNAQWGYWLDRDTGLYLCQARWYDPVTGRWVTRDPIGYAGGANLYGYCGGGPVGRADPSGWISIKSPAGVAALAMVLGTDIADAPTPDPEANERNREEGRAALNKFKLEALVDCVTRGGGAGFSALRGAATMARATNPGGRLGGPQHRGAVQAAANDMLAANPNWTLVSGGGGREKGVYTPSTGQLRFPDIHFDTPLGPVFVQVGRSRKSGRPVGREWDPIGDLTERGPVIWVPYK